MAYLDTHGLTTFWNKIKATFRTASAQDIIDAGALRFTLSLTLTQEQKLQVLSNIGSVQASTIATSGNVKDLLLTSGDWVVFDCGTSTQVI